MSTISLHDDKSFLQTTYPKINNLFYNNNKFFIISNFKFANKNENEYICIPAFYDADP